MIESLPSMCEVLGLIPCTVGKETKKAALPSTKRSSDEAQVVLSQQFFFRASRKKKALGSFLFACFLREGLASNPGWPGTFEPLAQDGDLNGQ